MNNNLIPVQRMDKNGRMVTRHVRVDAAKIAGSKVPAPKSSPSIATRRRDAIDYTVFYIEAMTDAKYAANDMPHDIQYWGKEKWRDSLEKLSDKTLSAIHESLEKGSNGIHQLVMSALYNELDSNYFADVLIATQYDTNRSNAWRDIESTSFRHAVSALDGLFAYQRLGWKAPKYISTASRRDREISEALIKTLDRSEDITGALVFSLGGGLKVNDGIARMVIEDPSKVDEICEIMHSRKTSDAGLVSEIMRNDARAIRDGVL